MDNLKDTWLILFKGEILTGFEPLKVKLNCMKIMNFPLDKVEYLFSGREVILRKGLDPERKNKYENLFRQQGMRVFCVKENEYFKATQSPAVRKEQKLSEQLEMIQLEPSTTKQKNNNEESNCETVKNTTDQNSLFNSFALELETPVPPPKPLKPEPEKDYCEAEQPCESNHKRSENYQPGDGFSSSSLADKFEFFNDQDKVTERPPFFGISTEGRFDQLSYIGATFICSLASWWLVFFSILFSASLILVVPLYLAFIRIQILRLHDMNLPWYWVLIHPVANLLIAFINLEDGFNGLITWHYLTISMAYSMVPWRSLTFIAALLNTLFFIFMSVRQGSLGENDYDAPVVDLIAAKAENSKFLSGTAIGAAFSVVLLLSIFLLRPPSPNAGGLPLTVQQLNAHSPRSGEFIQFEAYVVWHANNCSCSPFDQTCLPCTEGMAVFSDKLVDKLDMQVHYDLSNGRNKEEHKEYMLMLDPPTNIQTGNRYRFTVYSSTQAGTSKYTISSQAE